MKINAEEFPEKVKPIRDTDVYSVHDLEYLKHLNVSMTVLHPGKETTGHEHENVDEVYIVVNGEGELQMGDERFPIKKGDIMLIRGGVFHKAFNTSEKDLTFLCIFEKYEERGK